MKLQLPERALGFLELARSEDPARTSLNNFGARKGLACATDGHRMYTYPLPSEALESEVWSSFHPTTLELVDDRYPNADKLLRIHTANGISFDMSAVATRIALVCSAARGMQERAKADWRRILPKKSRPLEPFVSIILRGSAYGLQIELKCGALSLRERLTETNMPDFVMGLNPEYLLEALDAFRGVDITATLTSGHSPIVVHATDTPEWAALIMPMRV